MKKNVLLVCALLVSPAAHADRISRMNQTELCTYTAQLQVAAYYFFEQGTWCIRRA
jgi:ABC-type Mn2+/Zn2+ transport system permease subunit